MSSRGIAFAAAASFFGSVLLAVGFAAAGLLAFGLSFTPALRRMSPLAVEMWSVLISIPKLSLIQPCIGAALASLPRSFSARRTASCFVIFSAMAASRWDWYGRHSP